MPKINCGKCGEPQYLSEIEWCEVADKYLCGDCHDYCSCHDETTFNTRKTQEDKK